MSSTSSETSSVSNTTRNGALSHITFAHSNLIVKSAIQKVNSNGKSTYSFNYERATNPTMDNLRAKLLKRINDVPLSGTSAASIMGKQPTPKPVYSARLDQPKQYAKRTSGPPKQAPVSKAAKLSQPQQQASAPLSKTNFDATIEAVLAQPAPATPMPAPSIPPPRVQQETRDDIIFRYIREKFGNRKLNARSRRGAVRSLVAAGRITP